MMCALTQIILNFSDKQLYYDNNSSLTNYLVKAVIPITSRCMHHVTVLSYPILSYPILSYPILSYPIPITH